MMDELALRALWSAGIVLGGWAAYWLLNRVILLRLRNRARGLEGFTPGKPAVLYFTTPQCIPCKTQQRPALVKLTEQVGSQVQIIQVDATERPDLADYWGVLSVPTTFIIDSKGQPRGINHGVASAEKLLKQLEDANGGRFALLTKSAIGNQKSKLA
jgi:thiol-disulfide isomerase/thioredoxin